MALSNALITTALLITRDYLSETTYENNLHCCSRINERVIIQKIFRYFAYDSTVAFIYIMG